MTPANRVSVVPDLDDELTTVLAQVEELLLTLAAWEEEDPDDPDGLPPPLAGRVALAALHRVDAALRPTQTRTGRPAAGPRMLGPDGRYAHTPLRFLQLDQADVDTLGAAAAALGRGLLRPHSDLADAIGAGAEAASRPGEAGVLVEDLARLAGLLDLTPTADTRTLAAAVAGAAGQDLILDPAGEAAYQRTIDRINAMWTSGDPLARWTY